MNIKSWLALGFTGIVLGVPREASSAYDANRVSNDNVQQITIEIQPSFIYLPDYGFSISVKSPHDIIFFENLFYLYRDGVWYRSALCSGPWKFIRDEGIPFKLRSRNWEDIKRIREREYNKHTQFLWEDSDHNHKKYQLHKQEQQNQLIPKEDWNKLERKEHP